MNYFLEFHWWYLVVVFVGFFWIFGSKKGGVVTTRYTATLEVKDGRFEQCRSEADYTMFKPGRPHHIDIEIDALPLDAGEEIEFELNGSVLAKVRVKSNREAEFDHWSDGDVSFPQIQEGDVLVVKHQGLEILRGTFQRTT